MVAVGGAAVLLVVAFVVAVALGGESRQLPGERVAVVRADATGGVAVLAGRCHDQRVRSVSLTGAGGVVRWRAISTKGAVARRWVVGGRSPVGATVDVPLDGELRGEITATVSFEDGEGRRTTDARTVVLPLGQGSPELGGAAPPCGGKVDLGATSLLFAAGATTVLAGYGLMVARWWRARRD